MADEKKSVREMVAERLAARVQEKIPTSSLGRLGRTALTAFRGGRIALAGGKKSDDGESAQIDPEKIAGLIDSVGKLKGVAMKMGQIMSYIDVALPEELREALSVLQTHSQAMPFEKVRSLVRAELRDRAAPLLERMEETPISAASIGQVHRSVLPNGAAVAVKVRYPEMARAIEADFGPASAGTRLAALFYPGTRIDEFVKEAKERFLEECDYLHEAHCQDLFHALFADHPVIIVPRIHHDFCARAVLTMDFVDGMPFEAYLATKPPQEERDRIGAALFEFYIGSLFRHGIYNCDPHPGNYLFLPGGRVAMLDYGCTRQFDPVSIARMANLTRAVQADDRDALHDALSALKIVRRDRAYDYGTIRDFLRGFYGPMLVDETVEVSLGATMDLRQMQKKKMQLMRFSLPGEFLFLFRIRFGLLSVLARLGARANWHRLEMGCVESFAAKHPILAT